MIDLRLVFTDEMAAMRALSEAFEDGLRGDTSGDLSRDWTWPVGTHVSIIGPIMLTPATTDDEGNVLIPAALDMRCHVNLRTDDKAAAECLAPFQSEQDHGREWG